MSAELIRRLEKLIADGWTVAFECAAFRPAHIDIPMPDGSLSESDHCLCGDHRWLHETAVALREAAAALRAERGAEGWEPFLSDMRAELARAEAAHAGMSNAHEAYAVILEELDEFKTWVWLKQSKRDHAAMRTELLQIATMAWRTARDLGYEPLHPPQAASSGESEV